MAKSKAGRSKGYFSKGEVGTNKKVLKAKRIDYNNSGMRIANQYQAFLKGKNVVLTIDNPNQKQTNKRKIKINASEVWGNWRTRAK